MAKEYTWYRVWRQVHVKTITTTAYALREATRFALTTAVQRTRTTTSRTHLQPFELGLQVFLDAAAQHRWVGRDELFRGTKKKKRKQTKTLRKYTVSQKRGVAVSREACPHGARVSQRQTNRDSSDTVFRHERVV